MTEPVYAVIVAGGQGTRMGAAIPKQFLEINSKAILYHTIRAFTEAIEGIKLILVLPEQQISFAQMAIQPFEAGIDLTIVAGGDTRFQSVKNGLSAIDEPGIVMVHDGVRPLVSRELILRCYNMAAAQGCAIPVVPVTDSMRVVDGDASAPVDRNNLRLIQTPQTFKTELLLKAFDQEYNDGFTDEATVVEAFGTKVYLVAGERRNIKITTPEDLVIATALMNETV